MNEEKKQPIVSQTEPASAGVKAPEREQKNEAGRGSYGDRSKGRGGRGFGPRRGGNHGPEKKEEFEQKILDIARVTRVMAGGKRMRFRACVAIGDRKGRVGVGLGKGADVTLAVNKAVNRAKKEMIDVPTIKDTIPHDITYKYCAAKILFKPAAAGRGVKAGGIVRMIMELAGIKNITSKMLGSGNKVANARCTIEALKRLRRVEVQSAPKAEKPSASAADSVKAEEEKKINKKK